MPRRTAVAAAEPPQRRPRKTTQRAAPKTTTHDVQAVVEGVEVEDSRKVEFKGEYFLMADSIGLMPLLKFAHVSQQGGLQSDDMAGLAAMYSLISDCIDQTKVMEEKPDPVTGKMVEVPVGPSEWDRFERHAIECKADADDLMKLVQRVIERVAARPTRPPGGSLAGRQTTSANSKDSSSSPDIEYPGLDGMMSVADLDRLT